MEVGESILQLLIKFPTCLETIDRI